MQIRAIMFGSDSIRFILNLLQGTDCKSALSCLQSVSVPVIFDLFILMFIIGHGFSLFNKLPQRSPLFKHFS